MVNPVSSPRDKKVGRTSDAVFMELAESIGESMGRCSRRTIGAVIIKDGIPLAVGANGPIGDMCDPCPRQDMPSGSNLSICNAIHAEQQAIGNAARFGAKVEDATCYVTVSPCTNCTKQLIAAGIIEIVYQDEYPDLIYAEQLCDRAGIKIRRYSCR